MAAGIPSPAGKTKWSTSTVLSILTNEKYKGDALLQKTFCTDFLTKKMKVNEGKVPQYYFALKGLVYDDGYVSKQEDMLRTLGGLNSILKKMSEYEAAEKDPFTKYVISETAKGLKGFQEEVQQSYNQKYPNVNPTEK